MAKTKILIVEDELIIAEDMREILEEIGYDVPFVAINEKEGMDALKTHSPDLVILDIMMGDKPAGIELARYIRTHHDLPFIFCTSHSDRSTIEEVKATKPNGYLIKPFNAGDLYSSIEIALVNFSQPVTTSAESDKTESELLVKDGMFIKRGQMFVKVKFDQMMWLEPDGNYTSIVTSTLKYVVRSSLKDLMKQLPAKTFFRAHRSYVINVGLVQAIDLHHVKIGESGHLIPLGKVYRDHLIQRLNLIQ